MYIEKKYSKQEYTDTQALAQFTKELKELQVKLNEYGVSVPYTHGNEKYSYERGMHVWSVAIGNKFFNLPQQYAWEDFVKTIMEEDNGTENL